MAAAAGTAAYGAYKTAATVAAAAASAAAAYSSYRQGETTKDLAEYQAQQSRFDAMSKREQAQFAIDQQREQVRKLKGSQRVSLLASGVQLEGTALDLLADTELQSKIDEDVIRYNAELAARGLEQGAAISQYQGQGASTAGRIQAGTTLLSTAGRFASQRAAQERTTQKGLLN